MFFKFAKSFRIEDKVEKQTYRLTLSFIYQIHNVFYIFLLKSYHHRVDEKDAHEFIQISNLMNNDEL